MDIKRIKVILLYKASGRYALNILAGALGVDERTKLLPIAFVRSIDALQEELAASAAEYDQLLVCWSFYSPDFTRVKQEIAALRKVVVDPCVVHIAGGVHASAEPEQTLRAGFDYVALGEGERTIIEVCVALQSGSPLDTLQGIAVLSDNQLRKNGRGKSIALDDFPPGAPALHRYGPIEITRGCIYACKFCQTPFMHKAKFRHRSVDSVCYYVERMLQRDCKDFRFITPTSLSYGSENEQMNLAQVELLLVSVRKLVGAQRRIFFGSFPSEVRPEHVTHESLQLLRRYIDNDNIIIGGQSGSDAILQSCGRGHDVAEILRAVKLALEYGFKPNVDFLFGLPGEGSADVEASLAFAQQLVDLGARIHTHVFMPLPGTPYRQAAAGTMTRETKVRIETLTSRGESYGQWRHHLQFAQDLAKLRRR